MFHNISVILNHITCKWNREWGENRFHAKNVEQPGEKFKTEIGISIYMYILLALDIIKEKMEQLKNKNLFVLTVSEL